jgi:hypothetical protein
MLRSVAIALLAACCLLGCGHVDRQMTFTSNPTGALVYLNGREVGRTPVTVDFTWYGNYEVILRKEDYQTLKTTQYVPAPWWQWVPIDLAADVIPGRKVDTHNYHYILPFPAATTVPADVLIDRANSMRPMLESGELTRKPATRPAPSTAPAQ